MSEKLYQSVTANDDDYVNKMAKDIQQYFVSEGNTYKGRKANFFFNIIKSIGYYLYILASRVANHVDEKERVTTFRSFLDFLFMMMQTAAAHDDKKVDTAIDEAIAFLTDMKSKIQSGDHEPGLSEESA
jgi:hypothetical protein